MRVTLELDKLRFDGFSGNLLGFAIEIWIDGRLREARVLNLDQSVPITPATLIEVRRLEPLASIWTGPQ